MNLQKHHYLTSELSALKKMIENTPEDFMIERMGLLSRKNKIEKLLKKILVPGREPARARLVFRGKPVMGTWGIFTDFASQAINSFVEIVTAVGASTNFSLGTRGAIPDKDKYRMLITGTSSGSFGFILEEAPLEKVSSDGNLTFFNDQPVVETALKQTELFLRATLKGSDEELSEAISEVDPRALESFRKFLDLMVNNEAVCALGLKEAKFRFDDIKQVENSLQRICKDNIREEKKEWTGVFEGVLPKRRTFQFLQDTQEESIIGKISDKIKDPSSINCFLGNRMKVSLTKKTVGSGNPRYILEKYIPIEVHTLPMSTENR